MAERSFAKEVQQLRRGAGEVVRCEGILAITKALLENGVGYVGGYQGSPISHLMDVLSDSQEILDQYGVRFAWSASEAAAAAMLAASVMYPVRGAVTWKSTAGTNVASDALSNLASSGVTGGALVIVGEDYGEGSSIMQERSHAFAMKSQMWLLDPKPDLPSMVAAVGHAFALSEASNTPVMMQVRIRACHVRGSFVARDNRRPAFALADAIAAPRRDVDRIVLPPANMLHEREKLARRWPAAVDHIRAHGLNEVVSGGAADVGIILQGGLYPVVLRALADLGCADVWGETSVPLYVLNVTYPLVDDEVAEFCRDKRAVLVVEEGQPNYIEQAVGDVLRRTGVAARLAGKDVLPRGGEYTHEAVKAGLAGFLRAGAPALLPDAARAPNLPPGPDEARSRLAEAVPARPAGFCTGCPERPIFSALTLAERETGKHHIAADIGCHLFSILPPFNLGATTMGYGLGPASAAAFHGAPGKRAISVMGDGGFWHNGIASSISTAVFNKIDGVTIIVDNHYAAATGGQDIPSSRGGDPGRSTRHPIKAALEGVGVEWIRQIDDTYDVGRMRDTLKEALTTEAPGPKVIVASSECSLNKQRRVRPQVAAALRAGERVVRTRFGVDEDVCSGDHACIRLSGCPSLSLKQSADPLKIDPVASIDQTCVGCGHCGEAALAAILCPAFYRAEIVQNPTRSDRRRDALRRPVIAWLQRRRERGRLMFADA